MTHRPLGPVAIAVLAQLERGPATAVAVAAALRTDASHIRKTLGNLRGSKRVLTGGNRPALYALPEHRAQLREQTALLASVPRVRHLALPQRREAPIGRTEPQSMVVTALSSRSALERAWASL